MMTLSPAKLRFFGMALAYMGVCWVASDLFPFLRLTPGAFFLALLVTLMGGGGIGVAQLGYVRETIHTLSGKILKYPVVPEDAQSKSDKVRLCYAKFVFFVVAMYIETYWLKMLSQGKLNDPAWVAGKALDGAIRYFYGSAIVGDMMSKSLDLENIAYFIAGFPAVYAGFIYWVLHDRKPKSAAVG